MLSWQNFRHRLQIDRLEPAQHSSIISRLMLLRFEIVHCTAKAHSCSLSTLSTINPYFTIHFIHYNVPIRILQINIIEKWSRNKKVLNRVKHLISASLNVLVKILSTNYRKVNFSFVKHIFFNKSPPIPMKIKLLF